MHRGKETFAVGLARKRTCTDFADKHSKPTREGFAFHNQYTTYRTHLCRWCGVRGGLLPTRQVSRCLCPCGNRFGRGSRRLLEWRGLGHRCSGGTKRHRPDVGLLLLFVTGVEIELGAIDDVLPHYVGCGTY